jgi:hypothetical protein
MAAEGASVSSTLNYLAKQGKRPAYDLYVPTDKSERVLPERDKRTVIIEDSRTDAAALSLDIQGFAFRTRASAFSAFDDATAIKQHYYPEVAALVADATGAADVLVFDHNVRNETKAKAGDPAASRPVRFVHNDYTERSGPQRVKELLPPEVAAQHLRGRFAFINVWRPIAGPVLDMPLAVLDARSIEPGDFVATDLNYENRSGEVYSVHYNPAHRWHYVSRMQPDEVLLLKCFDSIADGSAQYTAHSAFADPTAPDGAPTRESIEARTIAFYE